MLNFNEKTLAKAKGAKDVEELIALGKESGTFMTEEQLLGLQNMWHKC